MAGFYESLRDSTAGPLISQYGFTVSIKRIVHGDYRTDIQEALATPQNYTAKIVRTNFQISEIDGDNIKAGDVKALVAVGTWEPQVGDQVTIDGEVFFVMDYWPLSPGGVDVLYTVQLRK